MFLPIYTYCLQSSLEVFFMSDSIYSNIFCRIVFSNTFSDARFLPIFSVSSFPEYHSPIGSAATPSLDGPISRMTLAWIRELAPVIIHINLPVIGEFLSFLGCEMGMP